MLKRFLDSHQVLENTTLKNNQTALVKKWNWDYGKCLEFQLEAASFIRENPSIKILIFTNHPHCFTLGTQLQRDKNIDLNYPLPAFAVHRGGGLTFHFPGQWIFYPILKISASHWGLKKLRDFLFESVIEVLKNEYGVLGEVSCEYPGIWVKEKKLASLGLGLKRYVSIHGLALNLMFDQKMKDALSGLYPCGLSSNTYTDLSNLISNSVDAEEFHQFYLHQNEDIFN